MIKYLRIGYIVTLLFLPKVSYAVGKPYCGLHCLYSAMKIEDSDIDFQTLLDPNYISYPEGSSLRELKQAAEEHGLTATPFKKFSLVNLKRIRNPAIIHVKMDYDQKVYDHFVLYLGKRDLKALILDPPGPVKHMEFSELAALWDGTGLIVSRNPVDISSILMPARIRLGIYMGIALACIGVYHLFSQFLMRRVFFKSIVQDRLWFRVGISGVQAVGILGVVFVVSVGSHFALPGGLLSQEGEAVEGMQIAYAGSFIPKINSEMVTGLLNLGTVFVDARFSQDFEAGHINGAISIPVDSSDIEREKVLAGIVKSTRIVVYCQSEGCAFAHSVAARLKADGFTKISIYKGGWTEWKAIKQG